MSWAFHPFVAQIKRNFRRSIASVSNEKEFLTQLRFKVVAHSFQRLSRASPSTHPITRIAPPRMVARHPHYICIQCDHAHNQSQQNGDAGAYAQNNVRLKPFPPEIRGNQSEPKKSESIPIRRSVLVNRQKQIKNKHGQTK